jgi:hypothetical protein
MKRGAALLVVLLVGVSALAQAGAPARRITAGSSLPPTCISSVVIRDIFYKSGSNAGLYVCTAASTWTLQSGVADVVGPASSTANAMAVFADTTGKLLADSLVLTNGTGDVLLGAGDNYFIGASAYTYVDGVGPKFVDVDVGDTIFNVQSLTADRTFTFPNASGTFTLGGNTFSGTGSVMRATMPILADTLFAALGTPANGAITYCSDCTKATPCAGSGTGAIAKRLNGAWDCD